MKKRTSSEIELKPLRTDLYEELMRLWKRVPGMGLSSADTKEGLAVFLRRNRGLSFAAVKDGRIVGTVLAGHDGRRGFLYHLCVAEAERKRGIGGRLTERALAGLAERGIRKCHVMVFADNEYGRRFWAKAGFSLRTDIALFSKELRSEG